MNNQPKKITLAYNKKFLNSDVMYVKYFKDTKGASDLQNFHTVCWPQLKKYA